MSYCCRQIPVPLMVLVFLLSLNGCGRDEIVELEPVTAALESQGEGEAADGGQTALPGATSGSGTASGLGADSGSGTASGPETASEAETPSVWVVHICGAVNRPGVYTFPEGSRVCDAVEAAGGLSDDAAVSSINQAALLSDGLQIVVPSEEEAEGLSPQGASSGIFSSGVYSADSAGETGQSAGGLVNINTASLDELMTLPGIGQTRAEAIVAYRQERGGFQTIEDIMKVSGIKEGSFEKLKEKITV